MTNLVENEESDVISKDGAHIKFSISYCVSNWATGDLSGTPLLNEDYVVVLL